MEPVPKTLQRLDRRQFTRRLFVVGLLGSLGCTAAQKVMSPKTSTEADSSPVKQVVTTWSNKITYAPDPTRGGVVVAGLLGRMYLFGAELGMSLLGDGKLVVDLYDHTKRPGSGEPVMLEQWNIDAETLSKLVKEDTFGKGYTLFLPWSTYRPDIEKIHLILRYDPVNGKPLLNQSGTMSLDHSATHDLATQK